jgi:hypothetical protein
MILLFPNDSSATNVSFKKSDCCFNDKPLYLEKDACVLGKNIHILEKDNIPGGALDGAGEREKGFVVRGGRMHEMHPMILLQQM